MIETPKMSDLECLVMWPKGSVGERQEREVVSTLLHLCEKHGFGRVPQLANAIEKIWRDPESVKDFQAEKEDHFRIMKEFSEATNND